MLAHQLPPIQQFTGEEMTEGREMFEHWIELLGMIAFICGWDKRTKLVCLAIPLRGQVYANTCTTRAEKETEELFGCGS